MRQHASGGGWARSAGVVGVGVVMLAVTAAAGGADSAAVTAAMKRAAMYFRTKVADRGGYVYYYGADLGRRWGEGEAAVGTVFVQPPGTPTVGMAYLKAYEATGDVYYLEAAREAGAALVYGQLESGGWTQTIHFEPTPKGRMGKYRHGKGAGTWNASSLDDGQTQAALEFLMKLDAAMKFKDEKIHEAATYGLDALLKAQFANGAFPQVFTGPAGEQPVLKAKYPEYDWRTEGKVKNYWDYYTLNDGLAGSVLQTLTVAHEVYEGDRVRVMGAIRKLGDFLVLAQMPEPQPAWCQQYGYEMTPIWARKFEPAAISGSESQDVMLALVEIARLTGDKKYLEPVGVGLAYMQKLVLKDGMLARFYELRTDRPLYMDREYRLTYDDSDVPKHYGWKHKPKLERIARVYREAKAGKWPGREEGRPDAAKVGRVMEAMDAQGRWVERYAGERLTGQPGFKEGFEYVSSATFAENLEMLARWVKQGGR